MCIKINLYPNSVNADRVMQKLINENFCKVIEQSSAYEFPLYDEKYSGTALLNLLVEEIFNDTNSPFWGKKTIEDINSYVINAGINSESIISFIKNTLLLSKVSKSVKKIFELDPKEKKIIERGEEYLKKYGHGMSIEDIKCIEKIEDSRTIVVRSQFGDYDLLVYTINGGSIKSNDPRINHIKSLYQYETGCPYFQARPVLYSTWINMDDNQKYATVY